jgi:hypothetical protein
MRIFFAFDIFSKVFFNLGNKQNHKGQHLANKEGEEAPQPISVSDILEQLPHCMTKHWHAPT